MAKKIKLKTHRGAAKRFKRTKNGKFLRGKAFKQHILSSKSRKRKRRLRGTTTVADVDAAKLARMLPYNSGLGTGDCPPSRLRRFGRARRSSMDRGRAEAGGLVAGCWLLVVVSGFSRTVEKDRCRV
jgi:large subunit ribosomal protein L35